MGFRLDSRDADFATTFDALLNSKREVSEEVGATVAGILALLHEQAAAEGRPIRAALAAPTGKAAARLQAIAGACHWLHADAPEAFTAAVAAFLDAG